MAEVTTKLPIDRAEEGSEKLLMAVGVHQQAPAVIAEVAQMRQRMFKLFVQAHDRTRRVIGFLRWKEGERETIGWSLYAGRNKSWRAEPTPSQTPVVSNAPITGAAGKLQRRRHALAPQPPLPPLLPACRTAHRFSVGN